MKTHVIDRGEVRLHCQEEGSGAPIVFANSLGTDLRLWDKVVPLLPDGLRVIRYDMRGHGQSSVPEPPYSMGALVADAEAVLEALDVSGCLFVGLSIGGMVAQGLAVKRLDLVRAMVLSNTAAKIGTKELWQERIDAVRLNGTEALADAIMERWFSKAFRNGPDLPFWRQMVVDTPDQGYIGCCAAIQGTDFYTPTSGLRLPTLGIAGLEDGSTPPDLVRETVDLIPGASFELIRGAGHLPCVEAPEAYAALLSDFIARTGHLDSDE